MTIFSNVAVNNFTQNTCGIDGITGKVILQYNITDTYCIEQKNNQLSSISERLGRELTDEMDARSSWVRNVSTVDPELMC